MLGRVDLYTSKFSHFALQQAKQALPTQRAFHIRPAAITVLSRLAYLQAKSALLPMPKPSPQKALPPNKNADASQHSGTRRDPSGSDKRRPHCGWPNGSGCIEMLSARTIVQTRAAPKRRGVGLRARSGLETALRHGKTRPALISGGRTAAGRAGRAV